MSQLLLVRNASSVLTLEGPQGPQGPQGPLRPHGPQGPQGPRRGDALGDLGVRNGVAVMARDGRIEAVGPIDELTRGLSAADEIVEVDARRGIVMPGFVDPHTHLVFAGQRAEEFEARLVHGSDYLAFVKAGGGAMSTVRATRAASTDELVRLVTARLDRMLATGTTTAEIKSGYGLSVAEELRQLEVVRVAAERTAVDVVATALPAHFRTPEHQNDNGPWLDQIEGELLPEVVARSLATSVDVFCEQGIYSPQEARRVIAAGRALGLASHLHADQLSDSGGAALAVELGALSADHLGHVSAEGIAALAGSSTIAVLIPGSALFVPTEKAPPARRMIEAGVAIALSTDCNPGTSPISSQPLAVALGTVLLGLTVAEGIAAATINAAHALGLADRYGSLEPGKQADLLVLDTDDHRELAYRFGQNLVRTVIKGGRVVVDGQGSGPL